MRRASQPWFRWFVVKGKKGKHLQLAGSASDQSTATHTQIGKEPLYSPLPCLVVILITRQYGRKPSLPSICSISLWSVKLKIWSFPVFVFLLVAISMSAHVYSFSKVIKSPRILTVTCMFYAADSNLHPCRQEYPGILPTAPKAELPNLTDFAFTLLKPIAGDRKGVDKTDTKRCRCEWTKKNVKVQTMVAISKYG